jgi:hypothetical protein
MGENKAACAKATRLAGVADPREARAEWSGKGCGWIGGQAEGSNKCQSVVLGEQWPDRMITSLYTMSTVVAVKVT